MDIKIPKGAEKYVLFQRTAYLYMARSKNPFIQFLYKIFLKGYSFNRYVELEATLFPRRIASLYSKDMNDEYATLKDSLPGRAGKILDIGCGMAGIDALIYNHYDGNTDTYLLDKTMVDANVFYLFKETGSFYNSLSIAKDLLMVNGVVSSKIHTQEATVDNRIIFDDNFDLVISLISWGFHYPVATYLEAVYEKMNIGGVLILDVRKDTDGEELLTKRFGSISTIVDEQKYRRVLVVKK